MRKVACCTLTAAMLNKNVKENVKKFTARGRAYSFMKSIKATLAYWKVFA